MHLTHEKNILLADQPLEIAQQVIRLHRDRELWTALSKNGLRNIEEHFSSAAAKHNLEELLVELGVLPGAIRPGAAGTKLRTGGALSH